MIIGQTLEIYELLKNVIIVIFAMKCTLIQTSSSLSKIHRILYQCNFLTFLTGVHLNVELVRSLENSLIYLFHPESGTPSQHSGVLVISLRF